MENKIQDALIKYNLQHLQEGDYKVLHFQPQDKLTYEAEPIDRLYILLSGKSKTTRLASNGEHHILCYYVSDGVIGDLELLTDSDLASSTSVALSEMSVIEIPYRILKKELDYNLKFLRKCCKDVAAKVLDNSDGLVAVAMESGESRLAAYILQGSYKNVFMDNLSDVARSIGVSYRHLFRLLHKFSEQGIIRKEDDTYIILKEKELHNIAKE